jgi:hypothetical protein
MKRAVVICLASCLAVGVNVPAGAADSFYMGAWKISGAVAAPWADPQRKPDGAGEARLLGKSIVLTARQITGPRPFACSAPHYKVSDFTPGMIFQGALEEMHSNNTTVDPAKVAASLGFAETAIKTLETGCEIDFHFVNDVTAEIGLNDYVYTLKKQ